MAFRCDLHVNGGHRRIILAPHPAETRDHLALRLCAFVLFWDLDPKAELSLKHPALAGQEFRPDVIALAESGEIAIWVECGNVSLHKLDKLTRRYSSRLVALKATEPEARRLRADADDQLPRGRGLEILAWPGDAFSPWSGAFSEQTEVVGESTETSLNLVINQVPLAVDFLRF